MHILLVTKTTNFELHGRVVEAKVASGRLKPDALARLKNAHVEHYATLHALRVALDQRGISRDEISREHEKPPRIHYDAVVTVGGDGTLLAASQKIDTDMRVYGVRSSESSVGYLCCAGPQDIAGLVQGIIEDSLPTSLVARVAARVDRVDAEPVTTPPVLNDFLYTNANPAATTRYRLAHNGQDEAHRSSGIWVATAVGSTAAIFAAGGERRPLTETLFQFRVRELYRFGHVKPAIDAGLFDPEQNPLEIENRCPEAILALDGQHGVVSLGYGDRLRFVRALPIRLGTPRTAPSS